MKPLALFAVLALGATSLFASADLVTIINAPSALVRAGFSSQLFFFVRNDGPDAAPATTVGVSSSIPFTCDCTLGDIPPGQGRSGTISFVAPASNTTITFSLTATSSVPNSAPAHNVASVTLTVSTDPDVILRFTAPFKQDLALPFTLPIFLGNNSNTTAHDLEATIDFRTDVDVKSLPSGCSSIAAGRVVCRLDSLPPNTSTPAPAPTFALQLVGPHDYGFGSITFTGVVTEREHDFDSISNTFSQTSALYNTFYVLTTTNDGGGSLRAAILQANGQCRPDQLCAIAFQIEQASPNPWKTINITTPLPTLTASNLKIDGATQAGFFGHKNADGPDIEISGHGTVDGDGLVVTNCSAEVANLAISGFRRNGVSVIDSPTTPNCSLFPITELHDLFLGTDPTGAEARANGRGIGMSRQNGTDVFSAKGTTNIHDCVLSGNTMSGIFALTGRVDVWGNRVGVKAHSDDALPNGASGIFIGPGGYGSEIGPDALTSSRAPNVIAFNREMGVAIAAGVGDVSVRGNRIWSNGTLGIDIGLDGPTLSTQSKFDVPIAVPILTLAHYDPVSKKTVIEGDEDGQNNGAVRSFVVDLYANDAVDPSGFGEGQRPIARTQIADFVTATHFRVAVDGDLTGQFITATTTRTNYAGFAKPEPEGLDQLFLTQTSEFGRAIEVR
jgi:hypothetical protein